MEVPILNTHFIIFTSCQLFTFSVISGLPFSSISSISSLRSCETSSGGKSSATSIIPNDLVTDDSPVMADSANFLIITPTDGSSQNLSPINCGTGFDNINLIPLSTLSKLNLVASPVYSRSIVQSSPVEQSSFVELNQLSNLDEPYMTVFTSPVSGSNIVPSININIESVKEPPQDTISLPLQYQVVEPTNKRTEKPKSDFVTLSNTFSSPCQLSSTNIALNCNSRPLSPAYVTSPVTFTMSQPNSICNSYINNAENISPSPNFVSTRQPLNKQVISVQPRYEGSINRYQETPDQIMNIGNLPTLKKNSLDLRSNFDTQSNTRPDPVPKSENKVTKVVTAQDFFIVDSSPNTMVTSLNNMNSFIENNSKPCSAEHQNEIVDNGNSNINSDQVIYFQNEPKDMPQAGVIQTSNSFVNAPKPRSDINIERNTNRVSLNTQIVQKVDNDISPVKVDKENNNVIYVQPQNNNDIKDKPIPKFTPKSNVFVENNICPSYSQIVNSKNLIQPGTSNIIQFSNENNNNLGCPQLKKCPISNDKIYFSNNYLNKIQSNNNNNLINLEANQISVNNIQNPIKDNTVNDVANIQKANNQGCPQLISLPLLNKGGILNKQIVNDRNCISDTSFNFNKNNQVLISNGNNQSPVCIQNSNLQSQQVEKSSIASNNVYNKDTIIENNVNSAQTVKPQNKFIIRRNNETALDKLLAQKNIYSDVSQTISNNGYNQPGNKISTCNTNIGFLPDNNNLIFVQNPATVAQTSNNININCPASSLTYNDNLVPINTAVSPINTVNLITSPQVSVNQLSPLNAVSSLVPTNIIASQNTLAANSLYSAGSILSTNMNTCNNLPGLISGNIITLSSNLNGNPFTLVPSEDKQINANNIVLPPNINTVTSSLNNKDVVLPSFSLINLAPSLPTNNNPIHTNTAPYINQPVIYNQNYLPNNNLQAVLTLLNSIINSNAASTTSTALNGLSSSNVTPVQSLPQVSFVNAASPAITVPPIQVSPSENYIPSTPNIPLFRPSSSFPTMQPIVTSPVGSILSSVLPQNNVYSSLNKIASSLTQNIISKLISKTIPMAVSKLPPVNPTKPSISESKTNVPLQVDTVETLTPYFNPAPPCSTSSPKSNIPKSNKINAPLRLDTAEPLAPYFNSVPPSSTRLPKSNIPVACNEYLPPISESQSNEYSYESDSYDSFMPLYTSNSYPYLKQCSSIFKANKATQEANKFGRYAESVVL